MSRGRFVLDLRKSQQAEEEYPYEELKALREAHEKLLKQFTKQVQTNKELENELIDTKNQLIKLQEDHHTALELIVALGSTFTTNRYQKTNNKTSSSQETTSPLPPPPPPYPPIGSTIQRISPFVPTSESPSSFNAYAIGIKKGSEKGNNIKYGEYRPHGKQ